MANSIKIAKLISEAQLKRKIKSLARKLNTHFAGKPIIVIGVLKGSFIFMADLCRHLNMPLTCDFLRIRSYDAGGNRGEIRLEFDLTMPIKDQHILVVEDIVDSGHSMHFISKHLNAKEPASLTFCSLLTKKSKGIKGFDFVGFEIPDKYVIGYGMDLDGRYRNLPYVAYLK